MQERSVCTDEAVGVVEPAPGAGAGFGHQHPPVGPALQAVLAAPQRQGAAVPGVGVVHQRHPVPAQAVHGGLGTGVGDLGFAGELRPGAAAIPRLGIVEHAPQPVGADEHGDAAVGQLHNRVLGPEVVLIIRGQPDVAVLGPALAAIAAHEHAVARTHGKADRAPPPVDAPGRQHFPVVLKGQQNAPVPGDNVAADEGAILQAPGRGFQRRPVAAAVVAVGHPLFPIGKGAVVGGHKEGAAFVPHHQLGGHQRRLRPPLFDAQVHRFQRGPATALVVAARDKDPVLRQRFGLPTAQHDHHPRAIGQPPQGGVARQRVRQLALEDGGLAVPGRVGRGAGVCTGFGHGGWGWVAVCLAVCHGGEILF